MTAKILAKCKNKKPLETTLGRAPEGCANLIDLSHIRKPIDTSVFGLKHVLQLFETATDEVRNYIAYECDIMYECRMCRTIFRSLANFVLHKRNYCRESYNPNDHTSCRNNCKETFLVSHEESDHHTSNEHLNEYSAPSECSSSQEADYQSVTDAKIKRNLEHVIYKLQQKQDNILITEECRSENVSDESKSVDIEGERNNNVALEEIKGSQAGVFQTIIKDKTEKFRNDLMKNQVMEIHSILENNEAIIGVNGKIVPSEAEKKIPFMCTVCNQKFSTKKTLTYHIKYKHNDTRLVYQCPECKDTFANTWSVFRHLYKIHRKTTEQVKKLRQQIHSNVIRKIHQLELRNFNRKSGVRTGTSLQEKVDIDNKQWMDDLESDNDLQRCGGCGRKFERKAALHSHSQFCSKRIAMCNTIKENNAKRTQVEEKQEKIKLKSFNTVTIEEALKGSRRRKQILSQKTYRIDEGNFPIDIIESITEDKRNQFGPEQELIGETNNTSNNLKLRKRFRNFQEENGKTSTEKGTSIGNLKNEEVTTENPNYFQSRCKKEKLVLYSEENFNKEKQKIQNEKDSESAEKINIEDFTKLQNFEDKKSEDADERLIDKSFASSINVDNSDSEDVIYISTINLPITRPSVITSSNNSNNHTNLESSNDNVCKTNSNKLEKDIWVKLNYQTKSVDNIIKHETTKIDYSIESSSQKSKKRMLNDDLKTENPKKFKESSVLKQSLELKSLNYINKKNLICIACKKSFKSQKSLMKHMALHFNWFRYECTKCSFMSYSRSNCEHHMEVKHAIHDEETLKNTIVHMPSWKTMSHSTDFKDYSKQRNKQKDNPNTKEEKAEISVGTNPGHQEIQKAGKCNPSDDKEIDNHQLFPQHTDVQDPSVRQMIMEVIFGSQREGTNQIADDNNRSDCASSVDMGDANQNKPNLEMKETSRPTRNRIPVVQKDFLYDV